VRPQKITFGETRDEMGVLGVLVYCADHKCSHSVALGADGWPDEIRLSGHRAALYLRRLRSPWSRCPAGFKLEPACSSRDAACCCGAPFSAGRLESGTSVRLLKAEDAN
jgi:hypothetical protein